MHRLDKSGLTAARLPECLTFLREKAPQAKFQLKNN